MRGSSSFSGVCNFFTVFFDTQMFDVNISRPKLHTEKKLDYFIIACVASLRVASRTQNMAFSSDLRNTSINVVICRLKSYIGSGVFCRSLLSRGLIR